MTNSKDSLNYFDSYYFVIPILTFNFLLFFHNIGPQGLDGNDFNFKMMSFYSGGVFRDAFEPALISINGMYPSLIGNLIGVKNFFPMHPSYISGLYLFCMFIPFTIIFIYLICRKKVYVPILLSFISCMNLLNYEYTFYYHLDKFFSLVCLLIIAATQNESESSFKYMTLFSAIATIAYPVSALPLLVLIFIKMFFDFEEFKTYLFLIFSILLFLSIIKYIAAGNNTYLGFDPLAGDYSLGSIVRFFMLSYDSLKIGFMSLSLYLISIISISIVYFIYFENAYKEMLKSFSVVLLFIFAVFVSLVVMYFLRNRGINVPVWQVVSYFLFPSFLIVVLLFFSTVFVFLLNFFISKGKFSVIAYFSLCVWMISLLINNYLIEMSFLKKDDLIVIAEAKYQAEKKYIGKSQEQIQCAVFSPFESVLIRIALPDQRINAFNTDLLNPKSSPVVCK